MMSTIRFISRIITAAVFIFSGFVKVIDPLGFGYKLSDYFEAFGFDFLMGLSNVIAMLVCAGELLIGLCLLFGLRMRQTAWALLLFMTFFLVLTLIVALTNPVTDCGCFGDAVILTNWETFFKNVILMLPTLVVFFGRRGFSQRYIPSIEWVAVVKLFLAAILLSVYCLLNLPIIDFRPYKIGTHIPTAMELPEGAPLPEYETLLVYEKDGKQQTFTPENVPWQDSTWKWVETKNRLVKEGAEPPIHDFSLTSEQGDDATDQLLWGQGYSLMVVSYKLERSTERGWDNIEPFVKRMKESGVPIYLMTSSLDSRIEEHKQKYPVVYNYYTSDEITLKTIVRSNPGLVLVKEGTIIGKWHHRNSPAEEFSVEQSLGASLHQMVSKSNRQVVVIFLLIIMFVTVFIEFTSPNKKN